MKTKTLGKSQLGQGMTEYIIIVAMIAVAAIAVYQYFGQTVRNQTAAIAQEIAGQSGVAAQGNAVTSAADAERAGNTRNTLDDYVDQANK